MQSLVNKICHFILCNVARRMFQKALLVTENHLKILKEQACLQAQYGTLRVIWTFGKISSE